MEHDRYNPANTPLFQCTAKRKDPLSSYVAADKASHTLTEDVRIVLDVLNKNNGRTAKELGKQLVMDDYLGEAVSESNIDDIIAFADLPHKKMSKLVELGYVRVEQRPGGNINFITDAGLEALK